MRKKTYLKLVEYQTEQSEKHLSEVRSIHKEMRGYKHDFHHHLQALKGQLEAGEVERALAYIEELDNSLMNVDTLLKTGNVSLDAILSAKIAQAKAENIAVTVKANVPDSLTISDVELSIVVDCHCAIVPSVRVLVDSYLLGIDVRCIILANVGHLAHRRAGVMYSQLAHVVMSEWLAAFRNDAAG